MLTEQQDTSTVFFNICQMLPVATGWSVSICRYFGLLKEQSVYRPDNEAENYKRRGCL